MKKPCSLGTGFGDLVPRVGLEPTHLAAGDFESPASTNFATWAGVEVHHFTDFYVAVKWYLGGDG